MEDWSTGALGYWSVGDLESWSDGKRKKGEMKMKRVYKIVTLVFCVLITWSFLTPALAEDVKRITKEELKNMLSDPSVVVVDVRKEGDWKASEFKIKGAVREDPTQVASWMGKYDKDKTLVFYCA
jgi:predicted sulfurtransferase